jgi:hypothetical protein
MQDSTVTQILGDFEARHDVLSFTVEDVRVWPYLRTWTAWQKMNKVGRVSAARSGQIEEAVAKLRRYSTLCLVDWSHAERLQTDAPVVFVTQANRRQLIGGSYHHPLVDPLCHLCDKEGVRAVVFEGGQARVPRARSSYWTSVAFKRDRWLQRIAGTRRLEPKWYQEYKNWAEGWLKREVPWTQWAGQFDTLFRRAAMYMQWFRAVRAKIVFVDCWYNDLSLPATLAGNRLGLKVVELQHARQSSSYFGYSGLQVQTGEELQLVPRVFWVWGERDREVFLQSNGEGFEVLVGGNAWLNQWRGSSTGLHETELKKTRAVIGEDAFSVVVTTQPTVSLDPVLEAMKGTPEDWRWLIRVHPSQRSILDDIEARTQSAHPNVEVRQATNCPLLPLLKLANVHLTGDSTCALEALGMGTPTILFDELGAENFAGFLENGTMLLADGPNELRSALDRLSRGALRFPEFGVVADCIFAPDLAARNALRSLLRVEVVSVTN